MATSLLSKRGFHWFICKVLCRSIGWCLCARGKKMFSVIKICSMCKWLFKKPNLILPLSHCGFPWILLHFCMLLYYFLRAKLLVLDYALVLTAWNKMEFRGKIIFFQLMRIWFEDVLGFFFPLEVLSLVAFLILSIFLQSQLSKIIYWLFCDSECCILICEC